MYPGLVVHFGVVAAPPPILSVLIDGEEDPVPVSFASVVPDVGTRVAVIFAERKVILIGSVQNG